MALPQIKRRKSVRNQDTFPIASMRPSLDDFPLTSQHLALAAVGEVSSEATYPSVRREPWRLDVERFRRSGASPEHLGDVRYLRTPAIWSGAKSSSAKGATQERRSQRSRPAWPPRKGSVAEVG